MSNRLLLTHISTHPTRARILKELGEGETYSSALGRKLELDPRLIRFHLGVLHRNDLIDGKLKETPDIKNIYAARYWWLTEKGKETLELIKSLT